MAKVDSAGCVVAVLPGSHLLLNRSGSDGAVDEVIVSISDADHSVRGITVVGA
ncbi:hypothetical protein ACH474_03440 [Nocardia rhamnosiphila]|uniref:hypothetical protein n=1 Tax=Nocardia rhamnosiphila TaxID=426716 RepID=UPI000AA03011|nr:hypothetical protein [Nocardia rhamnosiphila]